VPALPADEQALRAAAQIVSCEARVLSVPLEWRVTESYGLGSTVETVLLRLRDADGVEGHSFLWAFGPQVPVVLSLLGFLEPRVRGRPPRELAQILGAVRDDGGIVGGVAARGIGVLALAAYDMALHDLLCRRLGIPLSVLLGRRRETLPIYWSGLFVDEPVDELVRQTEQVMSDGYRALKLRVGRPTVAEDVARIEAVLGAAADGTTLMLDALEAWSPEEALRRARAFAPFEPYWLEDPIAHLDVVGLRRVVERSPVPIATGEGAFLREGFVPLLEAGVPYLIADLQRVGGVREWVALGGAAQLQSRALVPHMFPHLSLQLCAALEQRAVWVEHMPWWDRLMDYDLDIADGHVRVPDRPGNGYDFDWDAVETVATTPWQGLGP
jgi:L-alanine-DL-glutamate epimerase-like enolase superfamily enzyme